jgi:long-chain acyl-CoA synthetase
MELTDLLAAQAQLTGPGGQFEIVERTVLGQVLRDYRHAPRSVRELWLGTTDFADRTYIVYGDERLTYAEAHAHAAAFAHWLAGQGLRPGDRVGLAMRNMPEWLIAYWACVSSGLTVVGLNAWWTAEELAFALRDSTPRIVVCDEERLTRLGQVPAAVAGIGLVGVRLAEPPPGVVPWEAAIAAGGTMPEVEIDPDSDACIFYTSGTTGFPKGAQLTHRGCVANLLNLLFAGAAGALARSREGDGAPAPPPRPGVTLMAVPLFHVAACNCSAYVVSVTGGTLVMMYRWDAGEALRLIERERITNIGGVPTMVRELVNHPDFARTDMSSVAGIMGGGAPFPPELVLAVDAAHPTAKPSTVYGMTETCGVIASLQGEVLVDRPDSVGPIVPNLIGQCVDESGRAVPAGEIGELWIKGSSVVRGYLNQPEATAETITDGWLHTGDLARIDADGLLYIVDRKKDMVLRGGENVYCTEVEAGLYRHSAIAECCVFGVPDERLGEEVGVAIHLKPGAQLDQGELRAHCAGVMAAFKIPRYVWFLDEPLARNATGKFLRRDIRQSLLESAATGLTA